MADETRLDVSRYVDARKKGRAQMLRFGENYLVSIERFDSQTGEPAKPEEHALTRAHAKSMRDAAARYNEIADRIEADMDEADKAAEKR
jgi:hypothetical protein